MNDESLFASTERLFSLVESKLHLLREMQSMALEQADLVSQHEMNDLMTLLSRKQSLMESLQSVQGQLSDFKDEDPESRVWVSSERRHGCQTMVKQCDQLIQELIVQENRSIDHMNLKRDAVLSQIHQNAAAYEVNKAYAAAESELESMNAFTIEG